MFRVFVLDDHDIIRRGLADLLRFEPDLEVVGEAGTCAEAIARIPAVRPDIALLDVRLSDGSGIDVCRDIRSQMPNLRCIMLTSFDEDDAVFAAVMAGAEGYLLKQVRGPSLVDAIREVAAGHSLIDPTATEKLLNRLRHGAMASKKVADLSSREQEVLAMITEGLTNREIGDRLFLSEQSIKNIVSAVLSKLGMRRRTQAAVFGAELKRGAFGSPS